jgi:hypothetical protein
VSLSAWQFWFSSLIHLSIYVAIPNKAQKDLNKSTLEVLSQEVTSPGPEGLHLKLVSKAKSSSKFHPKIEAFRAGLSLEGQEPFLYIDIPEVKATAETDIIVEQDIIFEEIDRFTAYTKAVMGSKDFFVYMDGKTKLRLSGLQPISVDYNKKIAMKGIVIFSPGRL